jgi:hypothetical protein
MDPAKLAKEAVIIKAWAEAFGVAQVKVCKWNGPWVSIKLAELLRRMRKGPSGPK